VVNNNYPQITSVTSESLQAQIRNLLPSQEGFGTDLMAQNVIVPIIDLTAAAEGSTVPQNLQTAISFGSQTVFNGTGSVVSNPGFYRIIGTAAVTSAAGAKTANIAISDGLTSKKVWSLDTKASGSTVGITSNSFDFVVFLSSGETLNVAADSLCQISGSVRQIADVNGVLVNPSGFSPQ
jgi:hypothetical protein